MLITETEILFSNFFTTLRKTKFECRIFKAVFERCTWERKLRSFDTVITREITYKPDI
jgi:hypothetical protein